MQALSPEHPPPKALSFFRGESRSCQLVAHIQSQLGNLATLQEQEVRQGRRGFATSLGRPSVAYLP